MCLNTRFPLPTLLRAGYSAKLVLLYFIITSLELIWFITTLSSLDRFTRRSILLPDYLLVNTSMPVEASRGVAARGVTVKSTGSGFDPHSRR